MLPVNSFPDFDVIDEWILEPDLSGTSGGENLFESLEMQHTGNSISSFGVNCTPAGGNSLGAVGNSCDSMNSSFIGQQPSLDKHVPDSRVDEGGGAVVLKAEVVDGFLRKMKIEDENESGRVGESAMHVKEDVVEEDGGGGTFASVGGDWEKGGVCCGLVSAGGNAKKDASSSSSDTSSSTKEEEDGAVVLKAEVVDGFLRKMKIEDESESGRVGESAMHVKEDVEEDGGGGTFASVGGDWEKGGVCCGLVSVGGNAKKDASSSSSDTSSSTKEEEEDADAENDDVDEEEAPASSSASSSSSFLEDDDSDNAEVEEGEIRNLRSKKSGAMFVDSDIDEEEEVMKGPIKSKNEIDSEYLPPVPSIDVTLEPQHCTLPVGVVLSMMDNKVVVEGSEKHNPLTEGSILWITEKRLPLGLVDEMFGPVKNPYYVVRYNSDKEVPPGVQEGTAISFVPEFADHVLNNKDIYKKGYDASGENDEEILDEVEFSDDEKEMEYRKSQQQKLKRPTNDKKVKQLESMERKKVQNIGGFSNKNRSSNSGVKSLPVVPPFIPTHQQMHPSSGQFASFTPFHSQSQPPLPSMAPPLSSMAPFLCPPRVVNSQQMPNVSLSSACSPHVPNIQQIPNLPSNPFGIVGSYIPILGPFGTCGTMTNTFHAHGLPVPSTHGVQQPSYPVRSLSNFQQQLPSAWATFPSCQQQQQQPAGQRLPSLLGNPLQGVQNFDSPSAFAQESVVQLPGCVNRQEFINQSNLNGVSFRGGNTHGNPAANAVQQWDGMVGLNVEQTAQFNPNQCFGQFVPGTANNFSTPKRGSQINAPDNSWQPPKGGNFCKKKGHWQRPRQ